MTSNQAKIVLTNPCSESWDSMQTDDVGRFCQSCQKSVIDFTSKSDDEIQEFLKDKQKEKLCGRFYIQQIERIRIEIDPNLLVSRIPFWQKFLVVLLVCFGPDLMGYDFVFAQTETDSIPVQTEQVDSLAVTPPVEADTTLDAMADTLLEISAPMIAEIEWETISAGRLITQYMIMGDFVVQERKEYYKESKISFPFVKYNPETDSSASKTGIAHAENTPAIPKRRKRKPVLPENAVIADLDDRRKTKRS